jgi:hypothetical protein
MTRDVLAVRECWEQLARRSREIPSLELYAEAAHAAYLTLRGNYRAAIPRWEALIERAPPKQRVGWAPFRWMCAHALNAIGEHARARDLLRATMAHLTDADRELALPYAEVTRQLALAEAGLENHAEAVRILDEFLAKHAASEHPLVIGLFHKARAEVALSAADAQAFEHHYAEMSRLFRSTNNPSLIVHCDRLAQEAARAGLVQARAGGVSTATNGAGALASQSTLRRVLAACKTPEERWDRALEAIVRGTGAEAGYLHLLRAERLQLVAAHPGGEPPESVRLELDDLVERARTRQPTPKRADEPAFASSAMDKDDDDDDDDDDEAEHTITVLTRIGEERQIDSHYLRVLSVSNGGSTAVLGTVTLAFAPEARVATGAEYVSALAEAMHAAGDGSSALFSKNAKMADPELG